MSEGEGSVSKNGGSMPEGKEAMVARVVVLEGFKEIPSESYSSALSPDGTLVAHSFYGGSIRIWDARDGTPVGSPLLGHTKLVRSLAFSPDSTHLVSGSNDHTVRIWNTRDGSPVDEPLQGHENYVWSVAFSPDSTRIVSGSRDETVRIWDAHDRTPIGEPVRGHSSSVWSVAFSSDRSRIVSGSSDGTVRIWDAQNGSPIGKPLGGHDSVVRCLAFSPDGSLILSGSYDDTLRIWDARDGSPIGEPLRGQSDHPLSVAFSPEGRHIVSGSADGTVQIWDANDGSQIGDRLRGHEDRVRSVMFFSEGDRVMSSSDDGTVRVWDLQQSLLSSDLVSSRMSAQDMFWCLVRHGCTNLSSLMHTGRYSPSPVARGGFGDIWKGELTNGTIVAIKCVWLHQALEGDWKGAKRAMRETYVWSKARHENIQELTGVIMFQGSLGMVSPWMENGNLQKYLEANTQVDRYPLCIQLAAGMTYLHSIDMVHGDLKASQLNVLVSPQGTLKINDFDHSILANMTLRFSESSKNGGGTLRWMAPELLKLVGNEENATSSPMRNKQTDMYAFGMTLLEIVTGRIPYFEYRNDMSIYRAMSRQKPPKRPKELAETDERANQLWELLVRCWDHNPAVRPDAPYALSYLRILEV